MTLVQVVYNYIGIGFYIYLVQVVYSDCICLANRPYSKEQQKFVLNFIGFFFCMQGRIQKLTIKFMFLHFIFHIFLSVV